MKSNAQKVAELNVLFGNPKGDLAKPDAARLRKQAMLCVEESVEALENADRTKLVTINFQAKPSNADTVPYDLVGIMDAVGDMLTVAYGLAHAAGFDADEVYQRVHDSNMSKFVTSDEEAVPALSYYWNQGYPDDSLAIEGEYPQAIIRVTKDTTIDGKLIPAGKFLKNMNTFKEPNFYDLLPGYEANPSVEQKVASAIETMKTGVAS